MTALVIGGSGSGKSALAEQLVCRCAVFPRYYIATMKLWDEECRKRAAKHRAQRAGNGFRTLEVPDHLREAASLLPAGGCALLECIGNLTAHEQFGEQTVEPVSEILCGIHMLQEKLEHLVIVTNEVFTDRKPEDAAMQQYVKNIGAINCAIAETAEIVVEACSGIPAIWKGEQLFHEIMA